MTWPPRMQLREATIQAVLDLLPPPTPGRRYVDGWWGSSSIYRRIPGSKGLLAEMVRRGLLEKRREHRSGLWGEDWTTYYRLRRT